MIIAKNIDKVRQEKNTKHRDDEFKDESHDYISLFSLRVDTW
jgi:hypothetical protein